MCVFILYLEGRVMARIVERKMIVRGQRADGDEACTV